MSLLLTVGDQFDICALTHCLVRKPDRRQVFGSHIQEQIAGYLLLATPAMLANPRMVFSLIKYGSVTLLIITLARSQGHVMAFRRLTHVFFFSFFRQIFPATSPLS